MRPDRPLWVLVASAAATYPALGFAWCAAVLLFSRPEARALGFVGHPGAFAAILLVLVGAVAVGHAVRTGVVGLRQSNRFRGWVARREVSVPGSVAVAVQELGPHHRVAVVDSREQMAVTAGLLRPFVVISAGLVESLSDAELRAVLAHEHAHARRKDPLRALLARMLAAHLWFLPIAQDMRVRARREYELAADRFAASRCGRPALAGALLRVMSHPVATPGVVAWFADPDLLDARVAQLETGRAPRPAGVSSMRSALTAVGGLAFLTAVAGAWLFVLVACPCAVS